MPGQMSDPNPTFEDILHESTPEMVNLARKLRALILDVAPNAGEIISIKDRVAGYGSSGKMRNQAVYIALPKDWVRLGFYYGADLPDPQHLLEGEGKRLRHVKIRSEQDLQAPALRALIQAAIQSPNANK